MQIVVRVIKMRPQFRCRGKMLSGSKVPTQAVTVQSRHGSDVRKLVHGFLLNIFCHFLFRIFNLYSGMMPSNSLNLEATSLTLPVDFRVMQYVSNEVIKFKVYCAFLKKYKISCLFAK